MSKRDPFGRPGRRPARRSPVRRDWWARTVEEVYVYRTRKPWAPFAWVRLFSRHFAYGGRTSDPKARHHEHVIGGPGRWGNRPAQPWADLEPTRYVVFPLKSRTQLWTHLLEVFVIRVLFCVYNDKLNRYNPRRVSLSRARRQRFLRDTMGHRSAALASLSIRYVPLVLLSTLAIYVWRTW